MTTTVIEMQLRQQRKIAFLEKALFEYIQRSIFHHKAVLSDKTLRKVASGLKNMLKIDKFFPNRKWVKRFRNRYSLSYTQRNRTPPKSLDLKDILKYCKKNKVKNNTTQTTATLKPKQPKVKQETMELDVSESEYELCSSMRDFSLGSDIDSEVAPESEPHAKIIQINWSVNPSPVQEEPQPEDEPAPATETVAARPSKLLRSYQDALAHLKPLEDFALLKENFRAIGTIAQLKEVFQNPPKLKTNDKNAIQRT